MKNRKKNVEVSELDKLRLDYAWKWFSFHALQRMQLFNYFLIITGILATAFVTVYDKKLYVMGVVVCLIGVIQSLGFFMFDLRSRELTRIGEDVLEDLEDTTLFTDDYKKRLLRLTRFQNVTPENVEIGILQRERNSKMREGLWYQRGVRNFLKMKYWIWLIQGCIGMFFLIGLVVSIYQWFVSAEKEKIFKLLIEFPF